MTESLMNGERGVVILFVSCVLYCLPHSLIYEGLALCLLSFAGLLLEILAENSASLTRFKTRPGASSGILLGAVTLPTVMLSQLIQLLRVLPSDNIRPHEIGSQTVQYWVVSISCLSVLVYLCKVLHQSAEATSYFRRWSHRDAILSILYIIFYASCCYLSLAKSPGLHVTMKKLLWVLCHGLAAVKLIQHFLHTFPSCASIVSWSSSWKSLPFDGEWVYGVHQRSVNDGIFLKSLDDWNENEAYSTKGVKGEALLVTAGFNLYFGDMLGYTLSKLDANSTVAKLVSLQNGIRSEISIIIQGVLVGLLLFPVFYKFIVRIHGHFSKSINSEACAAENNTSEGIERSVVFYCSLAVVLLLMVPAWMQFVKDFHIHPFLWVLDFVFSEPQRLLICIFWTLCICVSVVWFYRISKNSKTERILLRKYYHLVAVVMFSPALIKEPHFLDLAFGAALAVFLVLEIIRVWKIWPLGKHIHRFMNAFTDHRDSDLLIISHFSLLLGCALPKWMSSGSNDRPFAPFAGILTLGIGDTMASIIGYKYGMFRWNKTGKKTVEGTAAGITSVMVACSCLRLASTDYTLSQNWLSLLFAVIASGLLEAYTAQLDNAFIPLVFYSLLCL